MRLLHTLLLLFPFSLLAQPNIELRPITTNVSSPVDITGSGDGSGRLFIVERVGRIKVYDQNTETQLGPNFLDIIGRVRSGGERGLLGLAFHPDFANNGYFYVNYTTRARNGLANGTTVVSRFTVPNGQTNADPSTELVLLTINQPFGNHNAGDLAFGPDGYLYITSGDGGGGGDPQDTGQDPQSLLGKMLRIDVDNTQGGNNYAIPVDNPFAGNPDTLAEIWSLGLRNPWRASFDRQTGDLWIADVGQNAREEVNFEPAGSPGGRNYGWDCEEGDIPYPNVSERSPRCDPAANYTQPIFDYQHNASGGRSVTGGFVYRGQNAADLVGWYVSADYVSENWFLLSPPIGGTRTLEVQSDVNLGGISTFGEDDDGNLFVASLGGDIFEVTTLLSLPAVFTDWRGRAEEKQVVLTWSVSSEEGVESYAVERLTRGDDFEQLTQIPARNGTDQTYTYNDEDPRPGQNVYRLRVRDFDGSEQFTRPFTVRFNPDNPLTLFPNPTNGRFRLRGPDLDPGTPVQVELRSITGELVNIRLTEWPGTEGLPVNHGSVGSGVYQVTLRADTGSWTSRLIIK